MSSHEWSGLLACVGGALLGVFLGGFSAGYFVARRRLTSTMRRALADLRQEFQDELRTPLQICYHETGSD